MRYGDPVHKVLKLLESENINPGNLLIGQTVDVKVIDARKAEFLRPMVVGEFYPDGSVLLKDELTQETIVLQFQWDTNTNGLLYKGESDFGVKYELEINRDLMSNQSITKLTESRRLNEASTSSKVMNKSEVIKFLKNYNDKSFWADEESAKRFVDIITGPDSYLLSKNNIIKFVNTLKAQEYTYDSKSDSIWYIGKNGIEYSIIPDHGESDDYIEEYKSGLNESRRLNEAAQLRPISEEDDSAFEVEEGPNGETPMFASGDLGEMAVSYHWDDEIYDIVIITNDDDEFIKEYTTYSKAMSDAKKLVKMLDITKGMDKVNAEKELKISLKSLKFK